MPKYLILGSHGQLGTEFAETLADQSADFVAPPEDQLDITDPKALEDAIVASKATVVLNCAAYNSVDEAEKDEETAIAVNATAVGSIAALCKKHRAFLVHYSTDYVFDGKKEDVYNEDDAPAPLNEYGKSKLAGEAAVKDAISDYLLFRLSWVLGKGEQNFLAKLHDWAKDGSTLTISSDEVSVPTYTADVVDVTLMALDKGLKGLYHLTNSGYASRYELSRYFFKKMGMPNLIIPVPNKTFKLPAKRPLFSVMTNAKISKALDIVIPSWEYGVDRYIDTFKESLEKAVPAAEEAEEA